MDPSKYTIKELKERLKEINLTSDLIQQLEADSRQGVKKLAQRCQKKLEQKNKLEEKWRQMAEKEIKLVDRGFYPIAGLDEAGRGPLAGPVVASAVVLKPEEKILGLDDSKKLSAFKREKLYAKIKQKAQAIGIGIIDNHKIDQINIHQASFLAMKKAIFKLEIKPQYLLIDGQYSIPELDLKQEPVTDGDSRVNSIAAASIIAKVTRDKIIADYHDQYPEYNFKQNKGYGTQEHIKALEEHGPCQLHRYSYQVVKDNSQN